MSETPGQVMHLAPLPGAHNEAIYIELLGVAREEFTRLQEEGII
jgi:crotonobetainyl-CoA:carnitine CoA-transferase CaiB-like acyl-CoA transferase